MKSQELYACVYIREFPTQSLVRLRPELKETPLVTMGGEVPFEHVCSLNTKARLLGVCRGLSRTDVDSFCSVNVFTRSPELEASTRELLIERTANYSPRVEDCSTEACCVCVVDITGTESLFGPPQVLARKLLRDVQDLGLSAHITISHNFHASLCLATASSVQSIRIIGLGREAATLASLPLNVLPLTFNQAELFELWGICNLGMLAEIPGDQLVARIGQDGRKLQKLATGCLTHHFRPIPLPFRLKERHELEFSLDSLDSLMFGIAVMLEQLIVRAQMHLVALFSITLSLDLEGTATYKRQVCPAQPSNDKQFWIRLLHLELQAYPPPAGVVAVTLQAQPGEIRKIQLGLFSPPLPEPARLDVTLAQLKSLLGDENVGHAVLKDSHAPGTFQLERFRVADGTTSKSVSVRPYTVLRQLRPPQAVSVELDESRPKEIIFSNTRFYVDRAYGPWLAGGEWWNQSLWNWEQWDVVAKAYHGSSIYCCIAHDLIENEWMLTALYD